MKQILEQLSEKAMSLIKNPAIKDPDTIDRLGRLPSKLRQMQCRLQEVEEESVRIKDFLDRLDQPTPRLVSANASSPYNRHSHRRKIRVVVNWTQLGADGGVESICEHMASESLVRFVTRLYEVKGIEVLEALSNLRVNRGNLVSKNPTRDYHYWNGTIDTEYQNRPIGDSGFSVLTHSDNNQKIGDIKKACQYLRFPIGAVTVEDVNKND